MQYFWVKPGGELTQLRTFVFHEAPKEQLIPDWDGKPQSEQGKFVMDAAGVSHLKNWFFVMDSNRSLYECHIENQVSGGGLNILTGAVVEVLKNLDHRLDDALSRILLRDSDAACVNQDALAGEPTRAGA